MRKALTRLALQGAYAIIMPALYVPLITMHPAMAFYNAVSLFVIAFFGLVISMYPYLVKIRIGEVYH